MIWTGPGTWIEQPGGWYHDGNAAEDVGIYAVGVGLLQVPRLGRPARVLALVEPRDFRSFSEAFNRGSA